MSFLRCLSRIRLPASRCVRLLPSVATGVPMGYRYLHALTCKIHSSAARQTEAIDVEPRVPPPVYKSSSSLFSTRNSIVKLCATLLVTGGTIGAIVYYYQAEIRTYFANVAGPILSHQKIINQAQELSKQVVAEILVDSTIQRNASIFINDFIVRPETTNAVVGLLQAVLVDDRVRQQGHTLLMQLLKDLLADPATVVVVKQFVMYLLTLPDVQNSLVTLVKGVLQDEAFLNQVNVLVQGLLAGEMVKSEVNNLGVNLVHQLLNDKHIEAHALEFSQNLLSQETLHKQAADAVRSAVKYTVPVWLGGKTQIVVNPAITGSANGNGQPKGQTSGSPNGSSKGSKIVGNDGAVKQQTEPAVTVNHRESSSPSESAQQPVSPSEPTSTSSAPIQTDSPSSVPVTVSSLSNGASEQDPLISSSSSSPSPWNVTNAQAVSES